MLHMYEITSCRVVEKYTTHISLKKHLTSYQKVFHANESAESYIYCLEHYVHGRKGYKCRLKSTISYFQWVSNVFHISLKFTHIAQCRVPQKQAEVAKSSMKVAGLGLRFIMEK